MTDFLQDAGLRALWQDSDAALSPLPLDEIKRRAAQLGDTIQRRNRREYVAAAIVVIAFALYAVILPGTMIKVGSALTLGLSRTGWYRSGRS